MPDVVLDWLLPDGRAAGRGADGRIVRTDVALPGDTVAVNGDEVRLVAPGPDRRAPPCPWSAACGGCGLDALEPGARRRALAGMVGHAFAGLGYDGVPTMIESPRTTAARARIKLAIEGGRLGYRAARSHAFVPVATCAVARPEVQEAHARLQAWLTPAHSEGLASVELRSNGARVVYAFGSDGSVPRAVREALPELGHVALDGRKVAGDPVLVLEVLGTRLQARPSAFYQVNLEVNERLVAHVRDVLVARGAERAVDLYAGIGNLSLPIANAGIPVVAVEAPGPGVEDLRVNAGGRADVEVIARRVERFDASRVAFDALVLDPPRSGARGVLAKASRNRPATVVYVSCHAPAAARDLRELRGYELVDLTCFELFLDSRHVEAVSVWARQ